MTHNQLIGNRSNESYFYALYLTYTFVSKKIYLLKLMDDKYIVLGSWGNFAWIGPGYWVISYPEMTSKWQSNFAQALLYNRLYKNHVFWQHLQNTGLVWSFGPNFENMHALETTLKNIGQYKKTSWHGTHLHMPVIILRVSCQKGPICHA